jgi:Transposase and inactivated derivatives
VYNDGVGSLAEYGRSAGAVHSIGWHVVWCPKYGKKVLVGTVAQRLGELIHAGAERQGWSVEALEVMPDHVHLLVRTSPAVSPARVAQQMKGSTSRWLRQEFSHLCRRLPVLWSRSSFVAGVGRVSEATIGTSIDEQTTRPVSARW